MAVPLEVIILVCFCVLLGPLEVKGQCDPDREIEQVTTTRCNAVSGCQPSLLPSDETVLRFEELTLSVLTGCIVTAPNNIITLDTLNGASECFVNIFTCRNNRCDPITQPEQATRIVCTAAFGCQPAVLPSDAIFNRFEEITPSGLTGCSVTAPNNMITLSFFNLNGADECVVNIFTCRNSQCDPVTQTEQVYQADCIPTAGCQPNILPLDETFNRFEEITPSGLTGCTVTAPNNILALGTLNGASECNVNIFTCRNIEPTTMAPITMAPAQCNPMTQTEGSAIVACGSDFGCIPSVIPDGGTFIRFEAIPFCIINNCIVTAPGGVLTVSNLDPDHDDGCIVKVVWCVDNPTIPLPTIAATTPPVVSADGQCDTLTQTEILSLAACYAETGCQPTFIPDGSTFARSVEMTCIADTGCVITAPGGALAVSSLGEATGCIGIIYSCANKIDPTTVTPTTVAPTTIAPTSIAPTTVAPTTIAPTTVAPTTAAPTTIAPTTIAPTTVAPTTVAPTTIAPTTIPPTTIPPTTMVPSTTETDSDTSDCSDTSEGSHSKDTSKGSHSPGTSEGSHSSDTSEGSHSPDTSECSHSR